jgi:microcystin-dependent protein
LLGNTYGGDGTTTFAVPDLRGRTIAGVDSGVGRLTATGLGVAATLAAVGGNQVASNGFHLPAIGVSVGQYYPGGGFGGNVLGAQSVNINTGGPSAPFQSIVDGSGTGVATSGHNHSVSGTTGGERLYLETFGANGGTNAYDGTTANGVNVQPTLVMRWIIKI